MSRARAILRVINILEIMQNVIQAKIHLRTKYLTYPKFKFSYMYKDYYTFLRCARMNVR